MPGAERNSEVTALHGSFPRPYFPDVACSPHRPRIINDVVRKSAAPGKQPKYTNCRLNLTQYAIAGPNGPLGRGRSLASHSIHRAPSSGAARLPAHETEQGTPPLLPRPRHALTHELPHSSPYTRNRPRSSFSSTRPRSSNRRSAMREGS